MTEELPVHINREELHALDVPTSFASAGGFDIRLINHGEPLRVHLHLDDALSTVASVEASNHYVERDTERYVRVSVDESRLNQQATLGKLKVVSGYGAETRWIDIELTEPDPESESVTVDESLAQPQPREPQSEPLVENPAALVLGLGLVALVVALVAVVFIQEPVVIVGALVVLGGVMLALYFLLRDNPRDI